MCRWRYGRGYWQEGAVGACDASPLAVHQVLSCEERGYPTGFFAQCPWPLFNILFSCHLSPLQDLACCGEAARLFLWTFRFLAPSVFRSSPASSAMESVPDDLDDTVQEIIPALQSMASRISGSLRIPIADRAATTAFVSAGGGFESRFRLRHPHSHRAVLVSGAAVISVSVGEQADVYWCGLGT